MSRSHHITIKDLRGFSKKEIDEMEKDKYSLLHQYAEKSQVKKQKRKERKNNKQKKDLSI